jgi:hypothetical protein
MLNIQEVITKRVGDKAKTLRLMEDDSRSLLDLATLVSNNPLDMNKLTNIDEYKHVTEFVHCLPFIGVNNIEKEFGKEALLLMIQELDCRHQFTTLAKRVRERCDEYSLVDFDQMRLTDSARKLRPDEKYDKRKIFRYDRLNYLTLDKIKEMNVSQNELSEILLKNKRASANLSTTALSNYNVEIAIPKYTYSRHQKWGWKDDKTNLCHKVFVDGLFGLMLMYKDEPNAIVSFSVDDKDILKITQFQGINPYDLNGLNLTKVKDEDVPRITPKGLYNIKFKEVLTDLGIHTAKYLGMSTIGIQSGYNNPWTEEHYDDKKIHLPLENALEIYDSFAKNQGFIANPKTRDWYLELK